MMVSLFLRRCIEWLVYWVASFELAWGEQTQATAGEAGAFRLNWLALVFCLILLDCFLRGGNILSIYGLGRGDEVWGEKRLLWLLWRYVILLLMRRTFFSSSFFLLFFPSFPLFAMFILKFSSSRSLILLLEDASWVKINQRLRLIVLRRTWRSCRIWIKYVYRMMDDYGPIVLSSNYFSFTFTLLR